MRKLAPVLLGMMVYCLVAAYIVTEYIHLDSTSGLRHFSTMHTLLGFVISLLLASRTNTAYDR